MQYHFLAITILLMAKYAGNLEISNWWIFGPLLVHVSLILVFTLIAAGIKKAGS